MMQRASADAMPSTVPSAIRSTPGHGHPHVNVDDGARRAALTLHAMQAPDREWLLAQLSDPEQQAIRTLLAELTELGIPLQSRFVADAVRDARPNDAQSRRVANKSEGTCDVTSEVRADVRPEATPRAEPLSDAFMFLNQTDPQLMFRLLRPEPPLLVARVLALHPWVWTTELLDAGGILRRRRIEEFGASLAANPPALANALTSLLCERVRNLKGRGQAVRIHGASASHPSTAKRSVLLQAWWQTGARCWRSALQALRGRA